MGADNRTETEQKIPTQRLPSSLQNLGLPSMIQNQSE